MNPGIYNFTISQNADLVKTFTWKDSTGTPINLTGYTAACQVRDQSSILFIDFLVNGSITVNGTLGKVTLSLPRSFTKTLSFDTANYDLFLYGPAGTGPTGVGASDKLIKGVVTLDKSVTQ